MNRVRTVKGVLSLLAAATLANIAFADGEAQPVKDRVICSFEKGTDGWWTFKSKDSSIELSQDQTTADHSKGSLKVDFKYGKGGAYLGTGFQTKWSIGEGPIFAPYAGGHLGIALKSDKGCRARIELSTKGKGNYSFRIPSVGKEWGTYSIPFDEFSNKNGKLDPKTTSIHKITVIPEGGSHKALTLWIDNLALSKKAVKLSTEPQVFRLSGTVTTDGKPGAGIDMAMCDSMGLKTKEETKTDGAGRYSLSIDMPTRRYKVTPASASPEQSTYTTVLAANAKGFASYYRQLTLKRGNNRHDVKLTAIKTPQPLRVVGNRLQTPDGKEVWLQGLCIDSLEWSATGERILQSIGIAIDEWNSNCIRLPMKENFWFGKSEYQRDGGKSYRELIDKAIKLTSDRGAYLILDLHRFGAPMPEHQKFWKDAAQRYKNNPAVIFELFNEPHGISWELWRNGGDLDKDKHKDTNVAENKEKNSGRISTGMQALVDTIRSTGANNLIIAGGLDWSYDISGIMNGYALTDKEGANGIMYTSHIYPWKLDWKNKVLVAADKYPLFIGEVGNLRKWEDFSFIGKSARHCPVGPKSDWPIDMLGMIQKYKINWTGFSFHPRCGPMVISDWDYTPTDYWGVHVKKALKGEQFELKRLR